MKSTIIIPLLLFFISAVSGTNKPTGQGRLEIGPAVFLYPDSLMPYTVDGSWSSIRNSDGGMTFFETAMAKRPYYYRHTGTFNDPLKTELAPFVWDYNGYNNNWSSGNWIQNIYKHSTDTLIGLVHREDLYPANHDPYQRNRYYIGIARSFDGGDSWKYLGDVLGNAANALHSKGNPNMGGVPALIVGPYIQLYFNEINAQEEKSISVARARLSDLIAAVRRDSVCIFTKYKEGKWNENGMTGTGSQIIPGFEKGYDAHSDAAYCAPLRKYLLTLHTHATSGNLLLYQSTDGVHWESNPIVLDHCPGMMHPYSSIVGFGKDSRDDSFVVGNTFYIYYVRKKGKDYDYDEMYYKKIQIK